MFHKRVGIYLLFLLWRQVRTRWVYIINGLDRYCYVISQTLGPLGSCNSKFQGIEKAGDGAYLNLVAWIGCVFGLDLFLRLPEFGGVDLAWIWAWIWRGFGVDFLRLFYAGVCSCFLVRFFPHHLGTFFHTISTPVSATFSRDFPHHFSHHFHETFRTSFRTVFAPFSHPTFALLWRIVVGLGLGKYNTVDRSDRIGALGGSTDRIR